MNKSIIYILLCATWFFLGIVLGTHVAKGEEPIRCDVNLILAIDVSGSISQDNYNLQRNATADAFLNPQVIKAIQSGPRKCIRVAVVTWANDQYLEIPWTVLKTTEDILAFSNAFANVRRPTGGSTSLLNALSFSAGYFQDVIGMADRFVIDISGDGKDNVRGVTELINWKLYIENIGIVVNGLPILSVGGDDDVVEYYEKYVKTTDGFVMPANGYEDFGRAILSKLMLEIM